MQADGACHSRTIENRMAAAKKAKARLRPRMDTIIPRLFIPRRVWGKASAVGARLRAGCF